MALSTANARVRSQRPDDRTIKVLMADDDRNDHLLVLMAADEADVSADFTFVDDGAKLMFHLAEHERTATLPDLIILDLRMPGLDGHRTLDELQAHPVLWQIPVIVFSSSTRRSDEIKSLDRGARWFETKPSTFDGLLDFVRALPDRAAPLPYDDGDDMTDRLVLLSSDVVAEVEDELLSKRTQTD